MRRGDINEMHEAALQERLHMELPEDLVVTRLYSHNMDVDSINQKHLRDIPKDGKRYRMQTTGQAAKIESLVKSVLAPEELELRPGAEVMFVANNFPLGFVNGTRGRVLDFVDNMPVVLLANGKEIKVERHSWKLEEDGKTRAEVAQLPLRLAWAITIHKSQGMSLDAAEIDLSRSFTPGMGYVALSRVRSMDGVYLTGVNNMARAREDKVSAFIIAHNTLLEELARRKPQTLQAMLGVKGLGQNKLDKYGEELLRIIQTKA
jgi:ATP-dependent DNA helicase PIF1